MKFIIIEYANILHKHGVFSRQAKRFIKKHHKDTIFCKRAKTLDWLFLNKDVILNGGEWNRPG